MSLKYITYSNILYVVFKSWEDILSFVAFWLLNKYINDTRVLIDIVYILYIVMKNFGAVIC